MYRRRGTPSPNLQERGSPAAVERRRRAPSHGSTRRGFGLSAPFGVGHKNAPATLATSRGMDRETKRGNPANMDRRSIESRPPTPTQLRVLYFLTTAGTTPHRYRDIMAEFGWRSTGAVACHLNALVRRGLAERAPFPGRPRGCLRVTAMGQALAASHRDTLLGAEPPRPPKTGVYGKGWRA